MEGETKDFERAGEIQGGKVIVEGEENIDGLVVSAFLDCTHLDGCILQIVGENCC